ncbi:MAG: divalent metal cation transporter [Sedimentisphaerales bacterium]|nr:divalent metal cation transporter [Sedimentisphaerales bacterium]
MSAKSEGSEHLSMNPRIQRDRQLILDARKKGRGAMLSAFIRLSGPGWLQSAITLGGGSLSSSLYLGILVGFSFLWLQPLAMIMGVIMLSAIAYVTLSTGKRPFRAINEHINPVLGWGWLIATMMANLVWCMPQFALGTAAIQQNLLRQIVGPDVMPDPWGKIVVVAGILCLTTTFVMFYTAGGRGVKFYEIIVKIMVGIIMLCFFGVIVRITIEGSLDWHAVFKGLIPDLGYLSRPVDTLAPFIAGVKPEFQKFWSDMVVSQQRDVMISAAATAVGINMTFLLPYSMLRKGWDRQFRGLAIFDLSTGLFFPFILATGCVVIASASQFHATPATGFLGELDAQGQIVQPAENLVGPFNSLMEQRIKFEMGDQAYTQLSDLEKTQHLEALPAADRKMAAMLVKRDAFNLAETLAPLTGRVFSHYIFGIGVLGMALGAISMLMVINGLALCELLNLPARGWPQRIGGLMVSVGALGPFLWTGGKAQFWLAIPTSVFGMVLLPIAYFTFFLLMNQKKILGEDMPRGGKRAGWNVLMAVAAGLAAFGSVWSLWSKLKYTGLFILAAFITLALVVQLIRSQSKQKGPA